MSKPTPRSSYTAPPAQQAAPRKPIKMSRELVGGGIAAAVGLVWLLAPGFKSHSPEAAPAPEAPSSEPALAMPAPAARAKAVEAVRAAAPAAAPRHVESDAPARPAAPPKPSWVTALASQGWVWPRHIQIQGEGETIERRLISWFPMNAAGKQLLYSLTVDRAETRLYEGEIPAFEARVTAEIEARRQKAEADKARKEALRGAPQAPVARVAPVRPANWTPEQLARLQEIRKRELAMLLLTTKAGAVSARDVTANGGRGRAMAEFTYRDGHKEVVPYDPLVFDLKGTGIKTSPKKVLFDLFGYGKSEKTQWMNDLEEGSGVLVFDAKGTGKAGKNGSEVFGDRTDLDGIGRPDGYANGFEALNALAAKAVRDKVLKPETLDKGVLDAEALVALEKAYGLKMKLGGMNREPVSLAKAGVAAIALSQEPTQRAENFDGEANDLLVQPGAVFLRTNGSTGSYMNVWLKAKIGNLGLKTKEHMNL